jgi:hypothetical protein
LSAAMIVLTRHNASANLLRRLRRSLMSMRGGVASDGDSRTLASVSCRSFVLCTSVFDYSGDGVEEQEG